MYSSHYTNDAYWWEQAGLNTTNSMLIKMHDQYRGNRRWQLSDVQALQGWDNAKHIFLFDCESGNNYFQSNDPRIYVFQPGRLDHPRYHFYPFWLEYTQTIAKTLGSADLLIENCNKQYYFDVLMGVPRSCRTWVVDRISSSVDKDKFLVNINKTPGKMHGNNYADQWISGSALDQQYSYVVDVPGIQHLCNSSSITPHTIYNNCWFSIISETHDDIQIPVITEKTAKALLGRRLFVHFGNPGLLQHLRDNGFQTFGSVIDEGYDLEPNQHKRLEQAWQQIKWILTQDPKELIQKCQNIFDYNQEIMLKYNFDKHIINELQQLVQAK